MERHQKETFIGYEYRDVTVKKDYVSLYTDGYENFGWEIEGTESVIQPAGSVILKFKRDRKLRNKAELTRLQRQFDSLVEQIIHLEKSKSVLALIVAIAIGILGTAFIAGSVFAISYGNHILLMIVLAIPGFVGWILPYFFYTRLVHQKTAEVNPVIEMKYDEIYEVTKRANMLLEH